MTQPSYHPLPSLPPTRPAAALRKRQSLAMPLAVIILGGLATVLVLSDVFATPLSHTLPLAVLFMAVTAVGVWFFWWLDRWEPEPPRLLIAAFLWGAGLSTLVSGFVNLMVAIAADSWAVAAVFSAPLIEETTKGLFLVLVVLTSPFGRAEFNSKTDAIVYAGYVGMGFTLAEDMTYVLMGDSGAEGLQIALLRIATGAFNHSIFAILTALGIWAGVNARGAMRLVWPFLGWLGAVGLHFLHNFGVGFGVPGIAVAVGVELVVFAVIIRLALANRRAERDNLAQQLPVLVAQGWISPREGGWLADTNARREQLATAKQQGKPQHQLLADFIQNATELAFLRARLDRQPRGSIAAEHLHTHAMLVGVLNLQRPLVDQVLGAGSWQPMQGRPGDAYGAALPSQQYPPQVTRR